MTLPLYTIRRHIGNGTFGHVYEAYEHETGRTVALKRQPKLTTAESREAVLASRLHHPNCIPVQRVFYSLAPNESVWQNLVFPLKSMSLHQLIKTCESKGVMIPLKTIRFLAYQMCLGLAHIHSHGMAHRDIKPENILLERDTGLLTISDFGSVKTICPTSRNCPHVTSRWYRAPEVLFGSTGYTTKIDVFSIGATIAEAILGRPLFFSEREEDQLWSIFFVMGTPSMTVIRNMNPDLPPDIGCTQGCRFPQFLSPLPLEGIFGDRCRDAAMLDLMKGLLCIDPSERMTMKDAVLHEFFDPIRRCPSSDEMSELFGDLPFLHDSLDEHFVPLSWREAREPAP